MKILTVAIPNHHFFQWVNQLEGSGHEVYWFDVTGAAGKSPKISWTNQITDWKIRWDFLGRTALKKQVSWLYKEIERFNEVKVERAFAKAYAQINPDIVHCFEMKLSGIPILPVMQKNTIPLIYSSWGSDMYNHERLGMSKDKVRQFLQRADYLITDCHRDHHLAVDLGFKGIQLGVFPGNGGIAIEPNHILSCDERTIILIKGYEDGVGKASVILKALESIDASILNQFEIVIYSSDDVLQQQIKDSKLLSNLSIQFNSRYHFLPNNQLLQMMGKAVVHIGNSISDGMPNALLEAMSMGAFPIQSNPGKVTEEVIIHGRNGWLIKDPENHVEISSAIKHVLSDQVMREAAQVHNVTTMAQTYSRKFLQPQLQKLYTQIALDKKTA